MSEQYLEAGIDWYGASLRLELEGYSSWRGRGLELVELAANHGNIRRFGSLLGYEGVSAAGVFIGERPDGGYLRASGRWAVPGFVRGYDKDAHVSRLDIQVTKRFETNLDYIGRNARTQATAANKLLPASRQRKIHAHDDDSGGYTLYVGARTSEVMGRIYNKSAQSDDCHYENTWRWEVEYHNHSATQVSRYLANMIGGVRPAILAGIVWQWFAKRGIECPWSKEEETHAIVIQARPETDIEAKLRWIETQVRPTVRLLQEHLGRGRVDLALGLDDVSGPVKDRVVGEGTDNGTSS